MDNWDDCKKTCGGVTRGKGVDDCYDELPEIIGSMLHVAGPIQMQKDLWPL